MEIKSNSDSEKLEFLIKKYKLESDSAMMKFLNPTFKIWNVEDNELLKTITFQYARSHEIVLDEKNEVGNEQRGQTTAGNLKPKSKEKNKWDQVTYSAAAGKIVGGPLIAVIRDYDKMFYSNFQHRKELGLNVRGDKYIIETDSEDFYEYFDDDLNAIKGKKFSNWPNHIKEMYLNKIVVSQVNFYYDAEMDNNLKRKATDFIHENDNCTTVQKIHSIESELNRSIKPYFGYRWSKYKANPFTEKIELVQHLDYKEIRSRCPMTIFADRILKTDGTDRGYDPLSHRRIEYRGYKVDQNKFIELFPYEVGIDTYRMYDSLYNKGVEYVDLSWKETEFIQWVHECTVTDKKWNKYVDLCNRFSDFYRTLQDVFTLHAKDSKKSSVFLPTKNADIRAMWRIFLELELNGKFYDVDTKPACKHTNSKKNPVIQISETNSRINENWGLEYEIAKLMNLFVKVNGAIDNADWDNYHSHRKSFANSKSQEKTFIAFFKSFLSGEKDFSHVKTFESYPDKFGNEVTPGIWKMDKSRYSDWSYNFKDPKRSFDPDVQDESYNYNGGMCFVTGKEVRKGLLEAHHKIYHEHGGKTNEAVDNCAMILTDLNRKWFTKFPSTSAGIEALIEQKPDDYPMTDKMVEYWGDGGLDELKKYEGDVSNYYWPTFESLSKKK